jgi:hypothetical protein
MGGKHLLLDPGGMQPNQSGPSRLPMLPARPACSQTQPDRGHNAAIVGEIGIEDCFRYF